MTLKKAKCFISPLNEDSISYWEIYTQSGLVSLVKPSMAITVDKGFLVPCKVHRPAFLKKLSQLSGAGVRKTQYFARRRVHVEHVIGKVKEHRLFSTVTPLSLTGSINPTFCCDLSLDQRPERTPCSSLYLLSINAFIWKCFFSPCVLSILKTNENCAQSSSYNLMDTTL